MVDHCVVELKKKKILKTDSFLIDNVGLVFCMWGGVVDPSTTTWCRIAIFIQWMSTQRFHKRTALRKERSKERAFKCQPVNTFVTGIHKGVSLKIPNVLYKHNVQLKYEFTVSAS